MSKNVDWIDRKDSTTTATGRYLALRTDDGNYIRYLHLRSSTVPLGARVAGGQVIAYSGASGFGSENGYGPHVHVSLWIGGTPLQLGFTNSVDFENYAQPEDPVPIHQSTTYSWNTVVPNRTWTTVPVGIGSYYLASTGSSRSETGDLTIYFTAIGVRRGLQVRVVAESLDLSGAVTNVTGQPVLEIDPTMSKARLRKRLAPSMRGKSTCTRGRPATGVACMRGPAISVSTGAMMSWMSRSDTE